VELVVDLAMTMITEQRTASCRQKATKVQLSIDQAPWHLTGLFDDIDDSVLF